MSLKSARSIMLATFKVLSLRHLTVRYHLLPLGKVLKIKCRSQGKYEMLIPFVKALIDAHHVEIQSQGLTNFKNILPKQVKVITTIDELLKTFLNQLHDCLFDVTSYKSSTGCIKKFTFWYKLNNFSYKLFVQIKVPHVSI